MTREDKLQRLRVASPCESSWEAMEGDGRRRHCLECEKHVYDFAQLTPREVAGLIEASRGHLCGRLTRDGAGRLVTLAPPPPAPRPVPGRVSPLAASVVTAFLGMSGTAWADQTAAAPPAVEQRAGERPAGTTGAAGDRTRRAGDTGGSVSGRLTTEQGEPVPDADVSIVNLLDVSERTGRTDADGRFSFDSLRPGTYQLAASVRGLHAAGQSDLFLFTGEQRQVGLTVPSDVWQTIVASEGSEFSTTVGVLVAVADPMRRVYAGADLVVLAVAGKSVTLEEGEYASEVRTDLVVSSVLKGKARERVVAVSHHLPPDDPAARFRPGDVVLAFLDPREAEDGRSAAGWVPSDGISGLRKLSETEVGAYRERLEALAWITRRGEAQPEDLVEWVVATAEDPATRKEALHELRGAAWQLKAWAERNGTPIAHYAQDLRGVIADFLAAGGKPAVDADDLILAAYLTDAHRERLTKALLGTRRLAQADLDLFHIVSEWHDDRLLPWLAERLQAPGAEAGVSRGMMLTLADALADESLTQLQEAGEELIGEIEEELYEASDDAERQRLEARLAAAEEKLRQRFVGALKQRGRR